jgi:hypothetical protein
MRGLAHVQLPRAWAAQQHKGREVYLSYLTLVDCPEVGREEGSAATDFAGSMD